METASAVGFVGLGNIGCPMATNLSKGGFPLIVFDSAGTDTRLPERARAAASVAHLAAECSILFMSLPNAAAVESVVAEAVQARGRAIETVVDLSTIGVQAAHRIEATLSASSIGYLDAPVSGGVAGARNRTIAIMCAGAHTVLQSARAPLQALSDKIFHVGEHPGQGQALKLLNNFLSATNLAAASEAVTFGLHHALHFSAILQVLNASSGSSAATTDKFPNQIANGRYASGFQNSLMAKDLGLFLAEAEAAGVHGRVGALVAEIWKRFSQQMPACDFTRIFQFVQQEISNRPEHR
jgi:3-hydroxyisobutyrate dehydrogenase-like beta-hydroxyacid dehydrogenase